MAEEGNADWIRPEFPNGRIKKIMKLDKDINKINSEALFLVSCSSELFLRFLAEKSSAVAVEKKRKTVKLEHLRVAVKRHRPTSDLLLEELPPPIKTSNSTATDGKQPRTVDDKPLPAGTRRIDQFFRKSDTATPTQIDEA